MPSSRASRPRRCWATAGRSFWKARCREVPLADVTLQQKDMLLALNLARQLGSPAPLAAAANEMMNACRGLGIDGNDFVVAHEVYRRLGGQDSGGQS